MDYDDASSAQPTLFDDSSGEAAASTPPPATTKVNTKQANSETTTTADEDGGDAPSEQADPGAWLAKLQESPPEVAAKVARAETPSRPVESLLGESTNSRYSLGGLAEAAGLTEDQIAQLTDFGLLAATNAAGEAHYDDDALAVARAVTPLLARGIEVRHLRAYKLAAEREAAMFEQLVMPLLRQRNPSARGEASALVDELTSQGAEVRQALLRQALRSTL